MGRRPQAPLPGTRGVLHVGSARCSGGSVPDLYIGYLRRKPPGCHEFQMHHPGRWLRGPHLGNTFLIGLQVNQPRTHARQVERDLRLPFGRARAGRTPTVPAATVPVGNRTSPARCAARRDRPARDSIDSRHRFSTKVIRARLCARSHYAETSGMLSVRCALTLHLRSSSSTWTRLRRSAFATTDTELRLMASAASIGLKSRWNAG